MLININLITLAVENKNQEQCLFTCVKYRNKKWRRNLVLTINLANINVAAFDIQIYFNNELLEYVSGPENTNVVGSKIMTVWYDETGGENPKQNCELVKYTFKAKEIESEYIAIQGEFYNAEGVQVQKFTDGIEIIANQENTNRND